MNVICKNCGQPISDGSNFCGYCGTAVPKEEINRFCSACGASLTPEEQFCHSCGTKVACLPNTQKISVKLLDKMKMASMYLGEPKSGYSAASGTLFIYTDRLEFHAQKGSALSSRSSLMGAIVNAMTKIEPITAYPLDQLVELRIGKYLAVYNTLVVVLKDETLSFCPVIPKSSQPQKILDMLAPYLSACKRTGSQLSISQE